jgi:hypothetical protein
MTTTISGHHYSICLHIFHHMISKYYYHNRYTVLVHTQRNTSPELTTCFIPKSGFCRVFFLLRQRRRCTNIKKLSSQDQVLSLIMVFEGKGKATWRNHPKISMKGNISRSAPGLGLATVAFAFWCAPDVFNYFFSKGNNLYYSTVLYHLNYLYRSNWWRTSLRWQKYW